MRPVNKEKIKRMKELMDLAEFEEIEFEANYFDIYVRVYCSNNLRWEATTYSVGITSFTEDGKVFNALKKLVTLTFTREDLDTLEKFRIGNNNPLDKWFIDLIKGE